MNKKEKNDLELGSTKLALNLYFGCTESVLWMQQNDLQCEVKHKLEAQVMILQKWKKARGRR